MMALSKAFDLLGGQSAAAKALGVSRQFINQCLKAGRKLPAKHCVELEKLTRGKVTCEELYPEIDWTYLRGTRRKSA